MIEKKNSRIQILLELFLISMKLGLTSFGGPIAHLGYFHEEYVRRKRWIDEKNFADLVALCQFLPGPASSQVGIGIGVLRAGVVGGIVSFLGFTLPSVFLLIVFALFFITFDFNTGGMIHGLKLVAVAIVAHAIIGMGQKLTPDTKTKTIALFSLVGTVMWQTAYSQVIIIVVAAIIGIFIFKGNQDESFVHIDIPISKRFALICISLFFSLLVLLPILRSYFDYHFLTLMDSFYRAGALVFGGGHVVLPLLQSELVPTGLISEEAFLAGYGITQAMPGPLFTFASYLGTVMNGISGGVIATFAIFLPAFLLIFGTLPFWNSLRGHAKIQGAWFGVNAAVVGILISAFYHPIWTSSVQNSLDFALSAILFCLLSYWKAPPWIIVLCGAIGGGMMSLF